MLARGGMLPPHRAGTQAEAAVHQKTRVIPPQGWEEFTARAEAFPLRPHNTKRDLLGISKKQ